MVHANPFCGEPRSRGEGPEEKKNRSFTLTTLTATFVFFLLANAAVAVPNEISFAMVGDIMAGSDHPSRAGLHSNPAALFAPTRDILSSVDLAIGNLEGGLAGQNVTPPSKGKNSYVFRMPLSTVALLRDAGFDILNIANNHSYDCGGAGLIKATNALTQEGLGFTGMAGSPAALREVRGVRVAVLGFSTYSLHNNFLDLEASRKLIEIWAMQCDILVVTFHGGAEGANATHVPRKEESYYRENRGDEYRFAHMAVDAGADLVFGHGPHVLRGMEIYKDRLVAYSMGNFLTIKFFNLSGVLGKSAILTAVLSPKGEVLRGKLHSLTLQIDGPTLPDPDKKALELVKELNAADFPGTAVLFNEDGSFSRKK